MILEIVLGIAAICKKKAAWGNERASNFILPSIFHDIFLTTLPLVSFDLLYRRKRCEVWNLL